MIDSTIYRYRKDKFTQQGLADKLNIPRTTMSFYETKRQYPDKATAQKIADLLEVTIGQLYNPSELEIIFSKTSTSHKDTRRAGGSMGETIPGNKNENS